MTKSTGDSSQSGQEATSTQTGTKERAERRIIAGGLPYSIAPGVFKKILDLVIQAERPDKFSANYMATILKQSGGAARSVPPLLKKMQFIGSDGTPTILYSKFKTDSGRSQAAYEGLKNAYSELFRRNEFVHKADENAVKDIIVEINGLKKTDQIVRLIYASFDTIRSFISDDGIKNVQIEKMDSDNLAEERFDEFDNIKGGARIGLSYQKNIVLPETENIVVFNAIFRSLRENLLK